MARCQIDGMLILADTQERENRLIEAVVEIVQRGGRCLIPVGAVGRAQVSDDGV